MAWFCGLKNQDNPWDETSYDFKYQFVNFLQYGVPE